jgi:methionyl-tRNA formyltransferase
MRIAFFGTPEFAVPSLRALIEEGFEVGVVVTQPDRPHGRSRSRLIPPPVKVVALEEGIPVLQPERPVGEFAEQLGSAGADVGVVVAYGHILRPAILGIPPLGMLNVHASLLPRWRGAAPIQWAILNGDETTGISIMQMEAGMDSGPVLHVLETEIPSDETAGELTLRLAELGAAALVESLTLLAQDALIPRPQDGALATQAPKISREVTRLDWSRDAAGLARQVRAFDPEPGAWALLEGEEVKLFGGRAVTGSGLPGAILAAGESLVVAAAVGAVETSEVQPSGRRRMPVSDWVRGRPAITGLRFM